MTRFWFTLSVCVCVRRCVWMRQMSSDASELKEWGTVGKSPLTLTPLRPDLICILIPAPTQGVVATCRCHSNRLCDCGRGTVARNRRHRKSFRDFGEFISANVSHLLHNVNHLCHTHKCQTVTSLYDVIYFNLLLRNTDAASSRGTFSRMKSYLVEINHIKL